MMNAPPSATSRHWAIDWPESLQSNQARYFGEGKVEVWQADLQFLSVARNCEAMLSKDENERASRFRFDRDRDRFIVCRAILRTLLGFYLGIPPGELKFQYSSHGKPSLRNDFASGGLCFNLSHSGTMALFAFARDRKIGVDVEQIRQDFESEVLAERFFSSSERQALSQIPASGRHDAFFHCWTRKEAFMKAKGEGLLLPLHQFDVSLTPNQPAEILATRPDCAERDRWKLHRLDVGEGYAGALAVENPITNVINYIFSSDSAMHAFKSDSESSAETRKLQTPNYA